MWNIFYCNTKNRDWKVKNERENINLCIKSLYLLMRKYLNKRTPFFAKM